MEPMELLQTTLLVLLCLLKEILTAYIGISFNENRQIKEEEFDRSLVPMIRLPRDTSPFLRPTTSSFLNPLDYDEKQHIKYTDNGLRPESDIKPISSPGKRLSEMLKDQRNFRNKLQNLQKQDNNKLLENGLIAFQAETDIEQRTESAKPVERNCYIDNNKILNSEEIYQNDCGTLQCIDAEVTWSLKPLARTLPRCEGTKSIPSMYSSYAKIKVVDDDEQMQQIYGAKSDQSKPDGDVIDSRKRMEEASKKMVEAEQWD